MIQREWQCIIDRFPKQPEEMVTEQWHCRIDPTSRFAFRLYFVPLWDLNVSKTASTNSGTGIVVVNGIRRSAGNPSEGSNVC